MAQELTSPLAAIIKAAAEREIKNGPAAESNRLAKVAKRFVGASDVVAVLCDCSSSMWELVGSLGWSKYQHLRVALDDLLKRQPRVRIVAFGSYATRVLHASELPAPCGGTDLVAALAMVKPWRVAAAVKAFWAVPPEVIVPEQSERVTLTAL